MEKHDTGIAKDSPIDSAYAFIHWNDLFDRAADGEVIKIVHNGKELSLSSYNGFTAGMQRVVDSALTLGREIERHNMKKSITEQSNIDKK